MSSLSQSVSSWDNSTEKTHTHSFPHTQACLYLLECTRRRNRHLNEVTEFTCLSSCSTQSISPSLTWPAWWGTVSSPPSHFSLQKTRTKKRHSSIHLLLRGESLCVLAVLSLRIMGFGTACTDGGSGSGPPSAVLAPLSPLKTQSRLHLHPTRI